MKNKKADKGALPYRLFLTVLSQQTFLCQFTDYITPNNFGNPNEILGI